jgi:hypothetical protein
MLKVNNLKVIPTFPHLSIDGKWGFIYNNNTGRWIYPKMSRRQSSKVVNVTCSTTGKVYTLKINDLILDSNGGTPDYAERVASDRASYKEIRDTNMVDVSSHLENFINFLCKTLDVPRSEIIASIRREIDVKG